MYKSQRESDRVISKSVEQVSERKRKRTIVRRRINAGPIDLHFSLFLFPSLLYSQSWGERGMAKSTADEDGTQQQKRNELFLVSLANEKRWLIRTLGLPFEAAPWWTHEEIRGGRCGNELLFERMQFSNLVRISPPSKISTFAAETREQNRTYDSLSLFYRSRATIILIKRASPMERTRLVAIIITVFLAADNSMNMQILSSQRNVFSPCFLNHVSLDPIFSKKFFSNHFRELDSNSSNSREGG